jgi:hypothetical protein
MLQEQDENFEEEEVGASSQPRAENVGALLGITFIPRK